MIYLPRALIAAIGSRPESRASSAARSTSTGAEPGPEWRQRKVPGAGVRVHMHHHPASWRSILQRLRSRETNT